MSVILLSPAESPQAWALQAALTAGLRDVRRVASPEAAGRHHAARPRSVLVVDGRETAVGPDDLGALRRTHPGLKILLLAPAGSDHPAGCDGVLNEPIYLVEVVQWCARALGTPLSEVALRDLSTGLSHEIGNPLTTMLLQLEMLKSDERLSAMREEIELIEESSRRIQNVLQDVARSTELRPIAPQATRLGTILEEGRQRLAERRPELAELLVTHCDDAELEVDLPLLADALADLWQYLLLAGNSAAPLEVRAQPHADGTVVITSKASVPRLPEDVAARLFTPLWARQALGLSNGLSLTTARSAFRRHHGDLRAWGQPGQMLKVEAVVPVRPPPTDGTVERP